MFKKKNGTPQADKLAALNAELTEVREERKLVSDGTGVAVLDEPDKLDAMRKADERLARREAELLAAIPIAEERASKESQRAEERARKAEERRRRDLDEDSKTADEEFERLARELNAAWVRCRDLERPPLPSDRHMCMPEISQAVRISLIQQAPDLARAIGGIRTGPDGLRPGGLSTFRERTLALSLGEPEPRPR